MYLMLQSTSPLTVATLAPVDNVSGVDVHAPAASTPNVLAPAVNTPAALMPSVLSQLWKLQIVERPCSIR